jgi:hypothetical protein
VVCFFFLKKQNKTKQTDKTKQNKTKTNQNKTQGMSASGKSEQPRNGFVPESEVKWCQCDAEDSGIGTD